MTESRLRISMRQRRVTKELRELRKQAGLTCADVATALGTSITKISRMETGERGMDPDDVASLLGLYHVPQPRRSELLDLVRKGADRTWIRLHTGPLPDDWKDLLNLESEVETLRNFEPLVVPGLLQTPEYARAVITGADDELTDAQLDTLVSARMARQTVLTKTDAPELTAIVEEAVLRRGVGGRDVMRRQLQHLLSRAERNNISIRVVPMDAPASPGLLGSLLVMGFGSDITVVYQETQGTSAFLEEEPHLTRAKVIWRRIAAAALPRDESLRLIASCADKLS